MIESWSGKHECAMSTCRHREREWLCIEKSLLLRGGRGGREMMNNTIIVVPANKGVWLYRQHERFEEVLLACNSDRSMIDYRSLMDTGGGNRMLIREQLYATYEAERGTT